VRRPRVRWWATNRTAWWVAALFIVGSTCFAIGAVPAYVDWVGGRAASVTFFVGSVFFTAAAALQLLLSTGAVATVGYHPRAAVQWRALRRANDRPEWWAGVAQLVGTLLFNVSTLLALQQALSATQENRRVWTPDMLGSIAFLVASALVFADVRRPWLSWRPHDLGWAIAMLNMVGSIAFGISAVASRIVTSTETMRDAQRANLGTFLGAVCFLVGAVLLIPDQEGAPTVGKDRDASRTAGRP
jgi:YrhK-like protein